MRGRWVCVWRGVSNRVSFGDRVLPRGSGAVQRGWDCSANDRVLLVSTCRVLPMHRGTLWGGRDCFGRGFSHRALAMGRVFPGSSGAVRGEGGQKYPG